MILEEFFRGFEGVGRQYGPSTRRIHRDGVRVDATLGKGEGR
jgi:hypothetical protein